jgi:hypothetical protein
MASDMREAIAHLPWSSEIRIQLLDHFTSAEVSSGASSGRSFQQSFPAEAEEELEGIRLLFRRKSFQKRQEKLLRYLLDRGHTSDDLSEMTMATLERCCLEPEGRAVHRGYLQVRTALGFDERPSTRAFHDVDGRNVNASQFVEYLMQLRRVRLNTEFNATICRGLLEVRYGVRQDDGLVQIERVVARDTSTAFKPAEQRVQGESGIRYRE